MKTLFALFSLLLLIATAAQAQKLDVEYPELTLPSGRVLLHTRVLKFDGETFTIQNANGISQLPWASMPADWQAKFSRDSARAQKIAELKREMVSLQSRPQQTAAIAAPAATPTAVSQFGTVMELPRHNMETTLEDLKVGITQEKLLRIMGNPLRINGTQWVYARGYIYVQDGVVVSLQNRYGDVFAADWKR